MDGIAERLILELSRDSSVIPFLTTEKILSSEPWVVAKNIYKSIVHTEMVR